LENPYRFGENVGTTTTKTRYTNLEDALLQISLKSHPDKTINSVLRALVSGTTSESTITSLSTALGLNAAAVSELKLLDSVVLTPLVKSFDAIQGVLSKEGSRYLLREEGKATNTETHFIDIYRETMMMGGLYQGFELRALLVYPTLIPKLSAFRRLKHSRTAARIIESIKLMEKENWCKAVIDMLDALPIENDHSVN
jgi:hypothetical protein